MIAETVNSVRVPAWRMVAAILDPDKAAGAQYAMSALREAARAGLLAELAIELAEIAANAQASEFGRVEAHSDALEFIHYRLDKADEERSELFDVMEKDLAR